MARQINLLPAEYRRRERTGNMGLGLGALGLLLLLLLGGIWLFYFLSARSTEKELEVRKQELSKVQAEINSLSRYEEIKNEKVRKLELVKKIYAQRYQWSKILGDFSYVIPENVWLTSLKAQAPAVTQAGPAGAATPAAAGAQGFEVEGYTYDHGGVATLMVRMGILKSLTDVNLTSSEKDRDKAKDAGRDVVKFKVVASLKESKPQDVKVPLGTQTGPTGTTPTTTTTPATPAPAATTQAPTPTVSAPAPSPAPAPAQTTPVAPGAPTSGPSGGASQPQSSGSIPSQSNLIQGDLP